MSTILNIGLVGNDGTAVDPHRALNVLSSLGGLHIRSASLHQSDTEPTLVIETDYPLSPVVAWEVAKELKQDAIAQWDGYDGDLYGPNAEAWGEFDPCFFIQPDGSRLSTVEVLKAA